MIALTTSNQDPPDHLGNRGRALWVDVLSKFGDPAPGDLVLLAEAASTLDELERMRRALSSEDVSVVGSQGQPVANRLLDECRRHRELLTRLFFALGIADEAP